MPTRRPTAMRHGRYDTSDACPVEAALELIGGKWKGAIAYHLFGGTRRFGELRKLLPRVTPRTLTIRLREMEADGLVHREVYAQVPPKVEYSLTERGRTLEPTVAALRAVGAAYLSDANEGR